jgi:ABC-type amino acid transport substrate-binding protein
MRNYPALIFLATAVVTACGSHWGGAGGDVSRGDSVNPPFDHLIDINPNSAIEGIKIPDSFKKACVAIAADNKRLAAKPLVIAMGATNPPDSYVDADDPSKMLGYQPAIAALALACLGAQFSIAQYPASTIIAAAQAGRVDILWNGFFYTPTRAQVLDFVVYEEVRDDAIIRSDSELNVKDLKDVCGHHVGVIVGSSEAQNLSVGGRSANICDNRAPMEVDTYQSAADLMLALSNRRVEVALAGEAAASAYADKVKLAFVVDTGVYAGISAIKGRQDLLLASQQAIKAIQEAGLQQALAEKYKRNTAVFPATLRT